MITTLIAWTVLGLIAGGLGKLIMPGKDPGGWLIQLGLGVGGAFLGGFLWTFATGGKLETRGFLPGLGDILIATLGAVILLAIYRFVKSKKA
ncbi:GlsB/YeaQ/YmgE family stress response membrane protein [Roseibacillus ishigakijimensis]|uniref:GlsB/YeaQ/YmgE family stress response membrane protein n=1 Tax=Roseibacillus ishigakijimensis TaxID=454146 RepID=A0A934VIL7_9BACT|nr:GlsB/YeaQ/YmgE family stress response membrane protein [Roseibacillus ishigakijimensis]MBK1835203.1 GlsB/YeaQ/YmgE family stress response membrane protein [Roseibacillus ishigakijimensis]